MENEVIVLGVKDYDFEKNGQTVVGKTVHYILLENYNAEEGYIPMKASLPINAKVVPMSKCKAKYSPVSVNGKLQLKLTELEYLETVEL